MFKGLANLGALLRHARQIGGHMQQLSEELKRRRASGSAGGGMVEIEINGVLEVLRCRIDEQLVAQGDCELIEDLVAAAMNQAVAKGRALHAEVFRELAGDVELPGLQDMIAKLSGMAEPDNPDEEQPSPGEEENPT